MSLAAAADDWYRPVPNGTAPVRRGRTGAEQIAYEKRRDRERARWRAAKALADAEAAARILSDLGIDLVDDFDNPTQSVSDYDLERAGQTVTYEEWCRLSGFDPQTRTYE